ncbi:hypothetical protein D4764_05G0000060 [Takifugu flavidus]|uniref:Uncharacterized protein n=1 Tax=Takifugu flavidus TaxID=433684 RepID=A0A5C6MXZ7_9TELE|nr:hypothetical protein D4764_05G0000060 [Takifugu flavidus]
MGCRLGEWDQQQRSRGRAEKSKPGEPTGTRDAEAEVVVRGRKQIGCPGNRNKAGRTKTGRSPARSHIVSLRAADRLPEAPESQQNHLECCS